MFTHASYANLILLSTINSFKIFKILINVVKILTSNTHTKYLNIYTEVFFLKI